MKKIAKLFLMMIVSALVLSLFAFADTYTPNSDGLYEVSLEFSSNSEYILFAIKGEYDVTNYIEALGTFSDQDLVYYEHKKAEEDGTVTFGPFAPRGYYDATLIVVGTNLAEPYLAGYLSADGALNSAKISISGIQDEYTARGTLGEDYNIDVKTKVFDSFGYESMDGEKIKFSLVGAKDGVEIDEETGALVISRDAEEQLFGVAASIGETTGIKYVEIKREPSVVTRIEFYDSEEYTNEVRQIKVAGTEGKYPSVTLYPLSFDQYGERIENTYTYSFDGKNSTNTVKPTSDGVFDFVVTGENGGSGRALVEVVKYEKNSLDLYNLIDKCEQELEKLGTEKFVCDNAGISVFSQYKWTTTAKAKLFTDALDVAKETLETYNGTNDETFASAVTTLKKAYDSYIASFKAGIRKDVSGIEFKEESYLFSTSTTWYKDVVVITEPRSGHNDRVTFESSDPSIVQVDAETGRILAKGNGTVTLTATTRGGLTATCRVTSYRKVTRIELDKNSYVAEYGKPYTKVNAVIQPNDEGVSHYGDTIVWSLSNPELADLVVEKTSVGESCTIIPKKSGETRIRITALNSDKTLYKDLEVIMPDWETVANPVSSVNGGNVVAGTKATLTSATEDAAIYYTLDGTTPSKENGRTYVVPITLSQDMTLKAVAIKDGMYDSSVVTYEYNVIDTEISIAKGVAKTGDKVKLSLNLSDFADIKTAAFEITYDSTALSLSEVVFADEIAISQGEGTVAGKYAVSVSMNDGQTFEGRAAELVFDVLGTAPNGVYDIEISNLSVVGIDNTYKNAKTQKGQIIVRDYILGDANDNGKIGLEDVMIIKQYAAGNSKAMEKILLIAADVNGDGMVDKEDSSLIAQYCVGLISDFN